MINHAEEATLLSHEAFMTQGGPDVALALATRAQVHATLALVDQQRVANELAFIKFALSSSATITDEDGLQKVCDRVVEGLGLKS